jgi:tRNA threonylcarbamoyladenosine biosynthesis protein TsaE
VSRVVSEAELVAEGERIGQALGHGAVVHLEGDLGSGKTTLARAIARGLGVAEAMSSPTYALAHRYAGERGPVYHLDCYRLERADDAGDLDWAGMAAEGDAVLIEWPERAGPWALRPSLRIRLAHTADPAVRTLEFV